MKKLLIFIFIIVFLTGCEQKSKFALVFTSDYEYGDDLSYVAFYDKNGKIIKDYTMDGAFYYNINKIGDNYYLNNDKYTITLNEDDILQKNKNHQSNGIIEMRNSIAYKDYFLNVHNYGYTDASVYLTKLTNSKSEESISIDGFLICYSIDNENIYLLLKEKNLLKINIINLENFSVKEIVDLLELSESSSVYGVNCNIVSNNVIFFIDNGNRTEMYFFDIEKMQCDKKKVENDSFNLMDIFPVSLLYDETKIYFIDQSKELMYLDISNTNKIKTISTGIKLNSEIGSFLILLKKDEELYVLDAGKKIKVVDINLQNKKIEKIIELDVKREYKNLQVYSFYVENSYN